MRNNVSTRGLLLTPRDATTFAVEKGSASAPGFATELADALAG